MSQPSTSSPVLVVGGGPVGLMAALLLAQQGQRAIVFEKRPPRASSAPKAHVLNPRSLEICRALGLDLDAMQRLAPHAPEGHCARFLTTLTGTEFGSLPLYDHAQPAAQAPTPTPMLNLAQPLFEGLLRERVLAEPRVELRLGHGFVSCTQDADGVQAEIDGPDGRYRVAGSWLVGADGANSAVREHLGIAMDGVPAVRPRITIHFEADLSHLVGKRPAVLYWVLDPAARGTFIAYDPRRTWVYTPRDVPERFDRADYPDARCLAMIRRAVGDAAADVRIRHVVPWMMAAQVAQRYRAGRCLLVGDAAHRFPPTGGLGLNTGIQDAHNLAWKLAAVQQGRAAATLLDSYEAERLPVARINTDQSLANASQLAGLFGLAEQVLADGEPDAAGRSALAAELQRHRAHFLSEGLQLGFVYGPPVRGPADPMRYEPSLARGARMPHAWLRLGARRCSTLDLLDPRRFTLLVGAQGAPCELPPGLHVASVPDAAAFEQPWPGTPLLRAGGALLLRPDGHVAAQLHGGASAARAALDAALAAFGTATDTGQPSMAAEVTA